MKPLTLTELKEKLRKMDYSELIELISGLYKSNKIVKEMISVKFIGEKYQIDALEEYKKKIYAEFFPKNFMKTPSLKAAKALITEFKKVGSDEMVLDLMLYYVECGNELTNEIGDMYASFYDSLCSVYGKFVDQMNEKGTDALYLKFKERIDKLRSKSSYIGWGYGDCISDKSSELRWVEEEE